MIKGDLTVQAGYDAWALTYDPALNRTRDMSAAVLHRQASELHDAAVVEVGCGTEKNTEWLAERARRIDALDFSDGMLAVARARRFACDVRFVASDVRERWPLDHEIADIIVVNLVLEHIERIESVFVEAERVLRAGGLLYVCEFHPARQLLGKQAHFSTGEGELTIDGFPHDVSDFVHAAFSVGLRLTSLREWRDDENNRLLVPRLVSLTFLKEHD